MIMSFDELKIALTAIASQDSGAPLIVETEHAMKGTDLEVTVPAERVVDAGHLVDQAKFALEAITGIDWPEQGGIEIVYDYTCFAKGLRVTIRAFVNRLEAELPSLSSIYPGANWHERETHDFFGVHFNGHPDLKPLLLPEDADFHPLRKDFSG
ncbi:MAG: NADH-quinone oxidoreductase subunit C [Geobacteraceae bacterium]